MLQQFMYVIVLKLKGQLILIEVKMGSAPRLNLNPCYKGLKCKDHLNAVDMKT